MEWCQQIVSIDMLNQWKRFKIYHLMLAKIIAMKDENGNCISFEVWARLIFYINMSQILLPVLL